MAAGSPSTSGHPTGQRSPSTPEALRQIDEMYGRWNAGVRELSDADLENPPTVGPERFPMEGIVLHVNRELIHHGAEISLLWDLYRWQAAPSLVAFPE
ncbi:DinB family protein [Micromonospora saelicesensis]|nr:DinB family protein [Micromonospora saelicesensis]